MYKSKQFDPWKATVPRLTPPEIRTLEYELPRPNSVWSIGNSLFEVYRVKDLFDPNWPNEALRELLIHARGSYYVYGDRPPLDEYDAKAAPYLVRVKYAVEDPENKNIYTVEEWLSDRLVPCAGDPIGGGELEYFIHQGQRTDYWLQAKFFGPSENYLDYTFASNRMCTISPYFRDVAEEESGVKLPIRQVYTAFCYTLMRYHFLEDYLKNIGARYKTSILRSRVIEKAMTIKTGEGVFTVEFTPAYQLLGLDGPRLIQVDRRAQGGAPYQFPGYFFDMDRLVGLLRKLLNNGKLSAGTLIYYLKDESIVREFFGTKTIHFEMVKDIGKLLSEKGMIIDSSISGDELRRIVDDEVPDGPELKISKVETLRTNCYEILGALGAMKHR